MSKKRDVSLSLNFNNENQYHFTVKLPRRTYKEDFWYLTAVNSVDEGFALALRKPLIKLLVEAVEVGHSIIHEPGRWLHLATARCALFFSRR